MRQLDIVTTGNVVALTGFLKSELEPLKSGKGFSATFKHTVLSARSESHQPDIWCQLYFIGDLAPLAQQQLAKETRLSMTGKLADVSAWLGKTETGESEPRATLKIYVNEFEVLRDAEKTLSK